MKGIKSAKSALRVEMKHIIKHIDTIERQRQSMSVFKKLCTLPQYKHSKKLSIYLSTSDEIDTIPMIKHMFQNGKEVYVPRYKGTVMEMVRLLSMEDYEKLPLTKWNIKQPSTKEIRESAFENGDLDLVILPGVAFTRDGKRLGHGMGYYDKFLKSCFKKQEKRPHLIAIAFNEQVKDDIPTSEDDVLLDMVLTEVHSV